MAVKSRATLLSDINSVIVSNGVGSITGPVLNTVLTDIVDSALSAATLAVTQGISFPAAQNPSADANTLDDYEEGTFTPTVIGSSGAGTATYSVQTGIYDKIGRRVIFSASMTFTGHTGTGNMGVTGLPFTIGADAAVHLYFSALSYTTHPFALAASGGIQVNIVQAASAGAVAAVPMDAACTLILGGSYRI